MKTTSKVWFVTGASKGMGLALVKLLLSQGHRVAATSRNVEELETRVGGRNKNLLALKVDITNDKEVKQALANTIETFGALDVLVNNAGYAIYGSIEELSNEEFHQSMEVNVFSMINTIRNAMPHFRAQKAGHIINFSSVAGYKGYGSSAAYNTAKFAVMGLSESLAEEVKHFGIKVTIVAPGFFRTSFLDKGGDMYAKNRIADYNTAEIKAWMQEMNGKQNGDPQKLVQLLVDITEQKNPPLHLLAGPDAYQIVEEKVKSDALEREAWKSLTMSTDFES